MDNSRAGLLISAWAGVKTSLAVCLAKFKQKNLQYSNGPFFMVDDKKLCGRSLDRVVYGLVRKFKQYLTHSPAYPNFFTLSKDAYNKWTEHNTNVSSK